MLKRKIESSETFSRTLTLVRGSEDKEKRTVEVAFSSEEPYERWFGTEVLSHDAEAVDLSRLNNGGALLLNHRMDDQIGVVVSARLDDDGVCRAVIRFSRSQKGEEIYQDVLDDIRQLTSVGYMISKYEVEEREGQSDLITATRWCPYEISLVSVPADTTVGVGRSTELDPQTQKPKQEEKAMPKGKANLPENNEPVITEAQRTAAIAKVKEEQAARLRGIDSVYAKHEHVEGIKELRLKALDEDWTETKFYKSVLDEIGKTNNGARAESQHDGSVDLERKEAERYSMTRLMYALSHPNDREAQKRAAFELEVSDAAVAGFGGDFKARGAYVPEKQLARALNVGTAAEGGDLVANNLLSGNFIELLRNNSALLNAGLMMLPGLVGTYDIPRQTGGAAVNWINGEDGDATESEPTFDLISLAPKDAAVYTEMTRRSLMQTTPAVDSVVRNDFAKAFALGIDKAGLYGTGATGQPRGVVNTTGINKKVFAAAMPTYDELINMMKLAMEDNAFAANMRWIFGADIWEALSTTSKQSGGAEGNFILGDTERVKGLPYNQSQQVTAGDIVLGDFSQLVMGEWGGLEVNVDPYTHSLKGRLRFIAFKTMDLAVRHPESFCLGNDTP